MTGWNRSLAPESPATLDFEGWNRSLAPDDPATLAFEGWNRANESLSASLAFASIRDLPGPCNPADLLSGKPVAAPTRGLDGQTYQRFTCATDWLSAAGSCARVGAHLATITSPQEQSLLDGLASGCEGSGCWIGASDAGSEGRFAWITDEPWDYENWASAEPNEHCDGEDYVHLRRDGFWNDQQVDGGCADHGQMGYICEWDDEDQNIAAEAALADTRQSGWEGQWDTKRGGITIKLSGSDAIVLVDPGDHMARYGGSIEVTHVSEQSMRGVWRLPSIGMEGTFQWTLDADGRAFEGQFSEAIGEAETRSWPGQKR